MIEDSKCLLELADHLDVFLDKLQKENNPMHRYETFYQSLLYHSSRFNELGYQVFLGNSIATPFLLTNWLLYDTGEDNYQHLRNLADKIRSLFEPSMAIGISEERIHQLMAHIEQRFGYCSSVLKDRPLRIIVTDDGFKEGNSLVMSLQIMGEVDYMERKDAVILTRPKDNISPEFVFLHELGHILHLRLTQRYDIFTPPSSFDFIINQMFSKSIDKPDSIKAELFAECFAMAALYDSEHSNYDYVEYIRNEEKILCYLYFKVLLETYESNDMGRTSWNELLTKIDTEAFIQRLPDNTSSH